MFTPVNLKEKNEKIDFFSSNNHWNDYQKSFGWQRMFNQRIEVWNFVKFKHIIQNLSSMFVKQKLIFTHLNSTTNLPINDGRLIAAFLTMIVWREITDFLSISLMKKAIAAVILILYCFLKNYFLNRFSVLQIIKFSFKIFDWQVLIFVSCFLSQLQFRSNGSFLKFFQRFGSKRLTLEALKKTHFKTVSPEYLHFLKFEFIFTV